MMNIKCENCEHFHKLKHNCYTEKIGDYRRHGWEESSCCTLYIDTDSKKLAKENFVYETKPDDKCEMFSER